MDFERDDNKADHNLQKRGVSFQEASTVFYDLLAVTFDDPDHSDQEDRFIIVGQSNQARLLFVAHVDRGERVHIISARVLKPKERRLYAAEH